MRWLTVLCLVLLCAVPSGAQTATVSGNLKDIGVVNATTPGAYVEFELRNYGSNIPKVSGTAVVAVAKKQFNPDANGVLSGTLYRNDNITPAGTFYRACVFDAGRQFRCADYTIAAASFDLNSATPITTSPVVTPPTGDTTYLRTDGGNQMSGNIIPNTTDTRTLGNSSARFDAVLDDVTAGKLNNILFVDGVKYPFTSTGLQACINDATPYKICDASAMPSFTSTVQINVGNTSAQTVTLIVPNGSTWSFNITDGTSCGIKQFNKSAILSYATAANGITFRLIPVNASVNMEALYCTENSPASGSSYIYAEGFMAENTVGATLAKGAIVLRELFDNSSFRNLTARNSNGVGFKIYEVCCGTSFYNLLADGLSGAGAKPVRIGDSTLGAFIIGGGATNVGFYGLSATHPGNNEYAIELGDSTNTSTRNANVENVQFYNVYMEPHATNTTTAGMKIWDDVHGIGVYGGSFTGWGGAATAYAIDLDSWAGPSNSVFLNVKSQSGNVINDNVTGKTVTGAANYGQAPAYFSGELIASGNLTIQNAGTPIAQIIGPTNPYIVVRENANNVSMKMQSLGTGGTIGTETNHPLDLNTNNVRRGGVSTSGDFDMRRYKATGTALVAGDFGTTPTANWGAGAAYSNIIGTDQGFSLTITAAGTPGASPTIPYTYKDLTWGSSPIFTCKQVGGTGAIGNITGENTATATAMTLTWNATPVAASTYIFSCLAIGR